MERIAREKIEKLKICLENVLSYVHQSMIKYETVSVQNVDIVAKDIRLRLALVSSELRKCIKIVRAMLYSS